MELRKHWTEIREAYRDFLVFEFCDIIGITDLQTEKDPSSLTLSKMIKLARKQGFKIAIIPYNDKDPENILGPVPAKIFIKLWEAAGRPKDFLELAKVIKKKRREKL